MWVLALLLVALLVWLVGQRVRERPHAEIGLTAGEELPAAATPAPTPVERAADGGELKPEGPSDEQSGGGGGGAASADPGVPVSPAPRR